MGDHLVVYMDETSVPINVARRSYSVVGGEDEPLIQIAECRICQEEDEIQKFEVPCACNGSLKHAHRKCVQRWCNEKGDVTCEICHQPYQPGYTAPTPMPPHPEDALIDIGGGWTISGTSLDLNDPRVLAITEAEHQLMEAEYDDRVAHSGSGAAFFRSIVLVMIALLLLRHALTVPDAEEDDDPSNLFLLFLIKTAGFLLPCYIMIWAITVPGRSILQHRQQTQEAAALAATQVAFVLQSGQHTSLQFTIAPRSSSSSSAEETV